MDAVATGSWSAAAVPESVHRLRTAVCEFAHGAGVADPPLGDLRLAVSEAVTNAVIHAYRDEPAPGAIDVAAERHRHELRVVVGDSGGGFAPRDDSPGAGFGLRIIGEMTDDLQIRGRRPRGTEVHMSFVLDA